MPAAGDQITDKKQRLLEAGPSLAQGPPSSRINQAEWSGTSPRALPASRASDQTPSGLRCAPCRLADTLPGYQTRSVAAQNRQPSAPWVGGPVPATKPLDTSLLARRPKEKHVLRGPACINNGDE